MKNKNQIILPLSFVSFAFLINWKGAESNVDSEVKHNVNFSGHLVSYQGREYDVDNIAIKGQYKHIMMYEKPANHPQPQLNSETNQTEIKLDVNPADGLIGKKVDLSEIHELYVPKPDVIWVYQKKTHRRVEFLEIDAITTGNTRIPYLLERTVRLTCDGIDPSGPQEMTVPLSTIKELKIEGYSFRNPSAGAQASISFDKKTTNTTVKYADTDNKIK